MEAYLEPSQTSVMELFVFSCYLFLKQCSIIDFQLGTVSLFHVKYVSVALSEIPQSKLRSWHYLVILWKGFPICWEGGHSQDFIQTIFNGLKTGNIKWFNFLSANPQHGQRPWDNLLNNSRRIVLVCLAILWGWPLKDNISN